MNGAIHGAKPRHLLDWLFWSILQKTWEKWFKKNSHWWHWRTFSGEVQSPIEILGDNSATTSVALGTNFRWQRTATLALVPEQAHYQYRIGFRDEKLGLCQLCSVVVSGEVNVLRGPRTVEFFAVDKYGYPLRLRRLRWGRRCNIGKQEVLL